MLSASDLESEVLCEEECGLRVEVVVVGKEGSKGVVQWSSVVISGLPFKENKMHEQLI